MPTPIKLVSLDIDGTIYGPKGSAFDLKKVSEFRSLVKKLRQKGISVIVCSGKTADYVEAFAEAYGLVRGNNATHICENGGIIFVYNSWKDHRYINLAGLYCSEIRSLGDYMSKSVKATLENKVATITLTPPGNASVTDEFYYASKKAMIKDGHRILTAENISPLSDAARSLFNGQQIKPPYDYFVDRSSLGINITPFPICKGFGLAYAARMQKIRLENVLSIADNDGDCTVFDIVGMPIAVSNATAAAKNLVRKKNGFVTGRKNIDGVIDVMKLLIKHRTAEDLRKRCSSIAE